LLILAPAVGTRLIRQLTGGFIDVPPDESSAIVVRTQIETGKGRPDLEICTARRLAWVEVKAEGELRHGQLEGYRDLLAVLGFDATTLVLLTRHPEEYPPEAGRPDLEVRWYEIADWIEAELSSLHTVGGVAVFLAEQFLGFLRERGMTPTPVDNSYMSDLIDWTSRSSDRRECSKMLETCVKTLWTRTGAEAGSFARYFKPHLVVMDFVQKHPTVRKCVQHVWSENSGAGGRPISDLGLYAGQSSAMLYLMGSCKSDGDMYRHHVRPAERCEEKLDWSMLDKAKEFWSLLAASNPDVQGPRANPAAVKRMKAVRDALALIGNPDQGGVGMHAERQAIIAKAWAVFAKNHEISTEDVALRYSKELATDGQVIRRWLDECPRFGGVDVGLPAEEKTDCLVNARSSEMPNEPFALEQPNGN
jgi:hypothetical protein